jgi:hypothetical protein
MALPRPKPQKKTNVRNPKDSNGKAGKLVKAQHKGALANDNVSLRQTLGTMGKGPKKTAQMRVKRK